MAMCFTWSVRNHRPPLRPQAQRLQQRAVAHKQVDRIRNLMVCQDRHNRQVREEQVVLEVLELVQARKVRL